MRNGAGSLPRVGGATIAVRRWAFISGGETTRQGLVLRISLPRWDRGLPARPRHALPREILVVRIAKPGPDALVTATRTEGLAGCRPPGSSVLLRPAEDDGVALHRHFSLTLLKPDLEQICQPLRARVRY